MGGTFGSRAVEEEARRKHECKTLRPLPPGSAGLETLKHQTSHGHRGTSALGTQLLAPCNSLSISAQHHSLSIPTHPKPPGRLFLQRGRELPASVSTQQLLPTRCGCFQGARAANLQHTCLGTRAQTLSSTCFSATVPLSKCNAGSAFRTNKAGGLAAGHSPDGGRKPTREALPPSHCNLEAQAQGGTAKPGCTERPQWERNVEAARGGAW